MSSPLYARDTDTGQMKEIEAELVGGKYALLTSGAAAASSSTQIADSTGVFFDPESCSHVYGYSGANELLTDTATSGASSWIKTYTYVAGNMTAESLWVKQ